MIGRRNTNRYCIRGYHTTVIADLMSKLKATEYMSELKSKVKVIKEVKVIQKMKTAGD